MQPVIEQNVDPVDPNLDPEDKGTQGGDPAQELAETRRLLDIANKEAMKRKEQLKTAAAERDELRKQLKPADGDQKDDYKALWKKQEERVKKLEERNRNHAVNDALRTELSKSKVASDKMDAALRLLDKGMISYDEDEGIDADSVTAARQKLENDFPWLFEKNVPKDKFKPAADPSNSDPNTIKRSAFDKLSPAEKHKAMVKDKLRVVD